MQQCALDFSVSCSEQHCDSRCNRQITVTGKSSSKEITLQQSRKEDLEVGSVAVFFFFF